MKDRVHICRRSIQVFTSVLAILEQIQLEINNSYSLIKIMTDIRLVRKYFIKYGMKGISHLDHLNHIVKSRIRAILIAGLEPSTQPKKSHMIDYKIGLEGIKQNELSNQIKKYDSNSRSISSSMIKIHALIQEYLNLKSEFGESINVSKEELFVSMLKEEVERPKLSPIRENLPSDSGSSDSKSKRSLSHESSTNSESEETVVRGVDCEVRSLKLTKRELSIRTHKQLPNSFSRISIIGRMGSICYQVVEHLYTGQIMLLVSSKDGDFSSSYTTLLFGLAIEPTFTFQTLTKNYCMYRVDGTSLLDIIFRKENSSFDEKIELIRNISSFFEDIEKINKRDLGLIIYPNHIYIGESIRFIPCKYISYNVST